MQQALAGEFTAGEEPCPAPHGPRFDLPLQVVVVDRDCAVLQIARRRAPVAKCVVDGARYAAAVRDQHALEFEPLLQLVPQWLGKLLPPRLSIVVIYCLERCFERINSRIAPDRLVADWVRAIASQFIELATCMGNACRADAVGMDAGIEHAVVAESPVTRLVIFHDVKYLGVTGRGLFAIERMAD